MMTGVSIAALAQLAHDVEPAEARQHDVEEDQVERFGGCPLEAALAVGARLDGIALARQPIGERHDEPRLVFDEQQPLHEGLSGLDAPRLAGTCPGWQECRRRAQRRREAAR